VGLSGEVVVDYVAMLEKALGPLRLWPLAYCNDVFGYLPSARTLAEGGYETGGIASVSRPALKIFLPPKSASLRLASAETCHDGCAKKLPEH